MEMNLTPLLAEEQISHRVLELGKEISKDYLDKKPLVLCVLKGSFMFYADLIRKIDLDVQCEFIGAASYGHSTKSSGEVRMTLDVANPIRDRDIIIVEDIIDTGLTMKYLQEVLTSRNPASVKTATLLHKPGATKVDCQIDYVGFEIDNDFVVGYGLDYQGKYRNLPYIGLVQNLN